MSNSYVGSIVKVKLINGSMLEGRVSKLSPSCVSLIDIHGIQEKLIKIDSVQIRELDIVSLPESAESWNSFSEAANTKPITIMRRDQKSPVRTDSTSPPHGALSNHDPYLAFNGRRSNKKQETFSISTNNMSTDFDFQSNNKLFRKDALFDEWRQMDGGCAKMKSDNMKHSEMVIPRAPQPMCNFEGDFVTDDKIPISGLSLSKRIALFKRALSLGLSYSHMISVAGLSISQMVIQVLGGSCRINTQNHNKPPVIVVLIANGECGKIAATVALHLHQHNMNVHVVVFGVPKGCEGLLNLLGKSGCLGPDLRGVPGVVDLIVDGVQDRNTLLSWPSWMDDVVHWVTRCPAPLLCIDPQHPSQMPSDPPPPKWTCVVGAPLLTQGKVGRMFLVDVGIPQLAFTEEGIPYNTPYLDKFVIPLHRKGKYS